METTTTHITEMLNKPWRMIVLLGGPSLSVFMALKYIASGTILSFEAPYVFLVLLLMWFPTGWSIPGLLTQQYRDSILYEYSGPIGRLIRGIIILPWMSFSRESEMRSEMMANWLGILVATLIALAR